jgi:nitrogen regulatory protein PII
MSYRGQETEHRRDVAAAGPSVSSAAGVGGGGEMAEGRSIASGVTREVRELGLLFEVSQWLGRSIDLLKKVRLEIAVNENFVKPTVDAIIRGARTGHIGDGKIFVLDLAECIRIRTGETGSPAIG